MESTIRASEAGVESAIEPAPAHLRHLRSQPVLRLFVFAGGSAYPASNREPCHLAQQPALGIRLRPSQWDRAGNLQRNKVRQSSTLTLSISTPTRMQLHN